MSTRAFHRRIHFGLGSHVTADEQGVRAKGSRSRAARSLLYIQDDDLAPLRHDVLGNRVTQAGSAARYDRACILNLHWSPLETPYPIISTASATASPPPMHNEAIPRFWPRRRRAYSRVVRMRAPVAPMGWPSAQAPPLTFTRAWSMSRSCMAAIGTAANASFIS